MRCDAQACETCKDCCARLWVSARLLPDMPGLFADLCVRIRAAVTLSNRHGLQQSLLAVLQKIPVAEWKCSGRQNVRPEGKQMITHPKSAAGWILQLCAPRACFPQLGTGGASSCHVEQSGIVMEGLPIVKARTSGCKHGAAGMPPTCLPLCLALEAVSYPQ